MIVIQMNAFEWFELKLISENKQEGEKMFFNFVFEEINNSLATTPTNSPLPKFSASFNRTIPIILPE